MTLPAFAAERRAAAPLMQGAGCAAIRRASINQSISQQLIGPTAAN